MIVDHWKINMTLMCCVNGLVLSPLPSPCHPYFTIWGSFWDFLFISYLSCAPVFLKEHFVFEFPSAWLPTLPPISHFTPNSWSWAEVDLPCTWWSLCFMALQLQVLSGSHSTSFILNLVFILCTFFLKRTPKLYKLWAPQNLDPPMVTINH